MAERDRTNDGEGVREKREHGQQEKAHHMPTEHPPKRFVDGLPLGDWCRPHVVQSVSRMRNSQCQQARACQNAGHDELCRCSAWVWPRQCRGAEEDSDHQLSQPRSPRVSDRRDQRLHDPPRVWLDTTTGAVALPQAKARHIISRPYPIGLGVRCATAKGTGGSGFYEVPASDTSPEYQATSEPATAPQRVRSPSSPISTLR